MNVCSIGIESQTYPGALNTLRWYSTPQTPSDPKQLRKIEMRKIDVLQVFRAKGQNLLKVLAPPTTGNDVEIRESPK